MSSSSRPNLSADALWLERATLIGDSLSFMFYGAMVIIFLQTMHALLQPRKSKSGEHRTIILIVFTILLFILGTIFVGMDLHSLQLAYIDHREYPGGPTAYSLSRYSNVITVFPNACFILTAWLADGFMLYRCIRVFHFQSYIIALPVLIYLGSIAMGILLLFQTSQPGASLWSKVSINFGLPYFALSMSLNVIVALLITTRLLLCRRRLLRTMGPEQVSYIPYVSVAAILIESSMFYAIFSLLFIGPYGAKSHLSNVFLPILSQVQIIAPMLITIRVATRRAWDEKTASAYLPSINFQTSGLQTGDTESTPDSHGAIQLNLQAESLDSRKEADTTNIHDQPNARTKIV